MGPRVGGPLGAPQQVDTTKPVDTPAKPVEKTQVKQEPKEPPKPISAEDKTARKSEHSNTGKMMAVKLKMKADGSAVDSAVGYLNKAGEAAAKAAGKAATAVAQASKPISNGSAGPAVENAQKEINKWRVANERKPIAEDGKFSTETEAAVRDFQKSNGLNPDASIGPNTRDRLALENDPSFKNLQKDTQKQVRDQMNGYTKDQIARSNLHDLATDSNFGKLSRDGQDKALQGLAVDSRSAGNLNNVKANVKDRAALEGDENFKKIPEPNQKIILNTMEKYSFEPKSREQLTKIATEPGFGKLSPAYQEETLKTLARNPADANYTEDLKKVIGSESFRNVSDWIKTKTFQQMGDHATNGRYTHHLAEMVTHRNFGAMSETQQAKTLFLYDDIKMDAKAALVDVVKRDVNGTPGLMTKTIDGKGTLLEQVERLHFSNLSPKILDARGNPADKTQVVEDLLKEIANPYRNINQSNRGTCSCTSMTFNLALSNPAEFGRIVTDLATTGQSKLAGGVTIKPPADAFAQDNSRRSVGERLFQSALMSYARDGDYQNNVRKKSGKVTDTGGTLAHQEVKVLSALHGKSYISLPNAALTGFHQTKKYVDAGKVPVYAALKWDGAGHAVEVTKIANGRVYFRNPWGGNVPGISNGVGVDYQRHKDPPRRTEDAANGIESMTEEDYVMHLKNIIVEE
ncbi:peptidoglycan-binding protein [bacterium]|nr:peptidoglycan-binding protein [bacterium]